MSNITAAKARIIGLGHDLLHSHLILAYIYIDYCRCHPHLSWSKSHAQDDPRSDGWYIVRPCTFPAKMRLINM
jgi:hypothetical protein